MALASPLETNKSNLKSIDQVKVSSNDTNSEDVTITINKNSLTKALETVVIIAKEVLPRLDAGIAVGAAGKVIGQSVHSLPPVHVTGNNNMLDEIKNSLSVVSSCSSRSSTVISNSTIVIDNKKSLPIWDNNNSLPIRDNNSPV